MVSCYFSNSCGSPPPTCWLGAVCSNSSLKRRGGVKHNYLASICLHVRFSLCSCTQTQRAATVPIITYTATRTHIITYEDTTAFQYLSLFSLPLVTLQIQGVPCHCHHADPTRSNLHHVPHLSLSSSKTPSPTSDKSLHLAADRVRTEAVIQVSPRVNMFV